MKKKYVVLSVKLTLVLLAVLMAGGILLTVQRAGTLRNEYQDMVEEYERKLRGIEFAEEETLIFHVYDALHEIPNISRLGFYAMLKDAEGNLLAEQQNFIMLQKLDKGAATDDRRILLLGDSLLTESDAARWRLVNDWALALEIQGTCDDTFIYLEKLSWGVAAGVPLEDIYIPEIQELEKGTMSFEAWAGENIYKEPREDNSYRIQYCNFLSDHFERYVAKRALDREAQKLCEDIYEDVSSGTNQMQSDVFDLLVCYVAKSGSGRMRDFSYAFVYHPLEMAIDDMKDHYLVIGAFGCAVVVLIWFLVGNLYKQQLAYETNRRRLTREIAHELKTPLAITKGYVENWEYLDAEKRKDYSQAMLEEMDHMNTLVMDLLELSRFEAKAKELHLETVDLYALTQSVLKRMKNVVTERGLVVILPQAEQDQFLVEADLEMLRVVLVNFISNAVKYAEKEIWIDISKKGRTLTFAITNEGKSIEHIENVWDEFYKEEHCGSGSSGLGLAIAKQILLLHNAKFGAKSECGKTVFWFTMKYEK